jgi:hypothetical protein
MMKALLIVTAAIEAGAGVALLAAPSVAASLLLGTELDTPPALTVARVAGAALLALGVTCWLARADAQSTAARGLIVAMLLYNSAAVAILAYAGIYLGLVSIALWPAVVLHVALAAWCVACLKMNRG